MSVVRITEENFAAEVMESDKPVLLDFWSASCTPCLLFGITMERIAKERPDLKVCKVNVDSEKGLARKFKIHNIPTLIVMKNGRMTSRALGIRTKKQVLEIL